MQAQKKSPSALSPLTKEQLILDLGHDVAQTEDDFMVCAGNELAFAHVMAFPGWAAPMTLLVGAAKSGKSHLARIWAKRAGAVIASADDVEALATSGGQQPVLVEDTDRNGYEEAGLFHLLNQSMRDERPILMTARTQVGEWPYGRGCRFGGTARQDVAITRPGYHAGHCGRGACNSLGTLAELER